ncbi:MAG: flagellar export protein FliJ [Gemmatimonas sp.]
MKSRETALRLKRFEAEEKTRKVRGLEQMIRDFEVMASDLDRQIQAEEDRTGVKDINHFAYSTFAKAASQRRNKLRASIDDLKVKLEDAVRERDEVLAEASPDVQPETREAARSRRRTERPVASMAR